MIDLTYALAGALTGFAVGVTGVGGGALMTPLLILVFSVTPTTAVATDLWFAVITKVVASAIHNKGGQVDWQVVRRLRLGSLPVAVGVVVMTTHGARTQRLAGSHMRLAPPY